MTGELIPLRPAEPKYDGVMCECGSAWFTGAITINREGSPTGYALPLRCTACGEPFHGVSA